MDNPADHDGLVDRLKLLIGAGSIRSFALRADVKDSTLRQILGGSRPSVDIAERLARAGGANLDWLVTGVPPRRRLSAHSSATPVATLAKPQVPPERGPAPIGELLQAGIGMILARRNISAAQLAEGAGLERTEIDKFLDGESNCPSFESIRQIAQSLDVTIFELLQPVAFEQLNRQIDKYVAKFRSGKPQDMRQAIQFLYAKLKDLEHIADALNASVSDLFDARPGDGVTHELLTYLAGFDHEAQLRILQQLRDETRLNEQEPGA